MVCFIVGPYSLIPKIYGLLKKIKSLSQLLRIYGLVKNQVSISIIEKVMIILLISWWQFGIFRSKIIL